jgi:V/A-type H+-transporting ATPase subunit I
VIEATVVSVQTTRLVLFEFFTRFFVSKGREFRPLPPPVFPPGGLRETKA